MDPVDLDQIDTWPEEIVVFLEATATELRTERLADHAYTLSDTMHRLLNPSPPMHRWDEAKAVITTAMAKRDLRAFHATRLVDFESIRENGLLRLNLERDILRLKAALAAHMSPSELMQVDAAVANMIEADSHFVRREGAVWMTPLRRFLHNGGCEVFFESFGGEAVERIAGYARGKFDATLKLVGEPAVVVARFPAYGWCRFTEHRLPQSMIELYLEGQGDWEPMDYGWDIMIKRDIPREASRPWSEAVISWWLADLSRKGPWRCLPVSGSCPCPWSIRRANPPLSEQLAKLLGREDGRAWHLSGHRATDRTIGSSTVLQETPHPKASTDLAPPQQSEPAAQPLR